MPLPNPKSEARENVRPRGRPVKDAARERRNLAEIREYLRSRRERLNVVKTTRTPNGQVLDWIPIESQVRGKIATPPSEAERIKPIRGRRAEERFGSNSSFLMPSAGLEVVP
jgi:hypothetical protein